MSTLLQLISHLFSLFTNVTLCIILTDMKIETLKIIYRTYDDIGKVVGLPRQGVFKLLSRGVTSVKHAKLLKKDLIKRDNEFQRAYNELMKQSTEIIENDKPKASKK